jgi:dTDP-4-dehydrorhamnose reductase
VHVRPLRIVVTGSRGRLGAPLALELARAGHRVTALTRADLDVTDADRINRLIDALEPSAIVNCTAYNAVDAAETDSGRAFAVNAAAPATLAAAADRTGAVLVHYSTDFVFDGRASEPYAESSPTNPLSVYGASKRAGEEHVQAIQRHYILRVESLFGGREAGSQRATVDYFAGELGAGRTVRAVADRTVTPSHVSDAIRATRFLLEREAPFGIYHCVSSGCTTWLEMARAIAEHLGSRGDVMAIAAESLTAPAVRPLFCGLSNAKLVGLGCAMPTWQACLAAHLQSRYVQPFSTHLRPRRLA